jgi:hypothetical protein
MAATLTAEAELLEKTGGRAATKAIRSRLSEWERHEILIAAAAAAAAGGPVRILDIRPVEAAGSRWSRKGRLGNPALTPRPARARHAAEPLPAPPETETQEEEQTP